MNEWQSDFALLREFVSERHQSAFATLARRHFDLVYSTALRKVSDPGGAEEIAQNVFCALAHKAWQFASDDSLPAWLHKTALLESKTWVRGELRRRRREQAAAELGTTMKTPEEQPAFQALLPLLDEALLSLREKDRTALLLRFCESHSLREVGVAFGVSEDTAQKRVQSALEKLVEFFKRRGFKTVSVAAAAAALQNTVTTSSATLVSAVLSAALQAASPAIGLTALLARFASLSRVQTGALCAALAVLPIGWQVKERNGVAQETKRTQAQLLDSQRQYAAAQADLERLKADSQSLEQDVARANEAETRAAESARAFEVWKQKTRNQLTAAEYRWDDDSAFVRIPKAILPELSEFAGLDPFSNPDLGNPNTLMVKPFASELMGMTPAERRAVEDAMRRHSADFADLVRGREARIYETNQTFATGETQKVFVLPAVPKDEVKERGDRMLAELRDVLGEERLALVEIRFQEKTRRPDNNNGNMKTILDLDSGRTAEELSVRLGTDEKGTSTFTLGVSFGGIAGGWNGVLSDFLPEGDPRRTNPSGERGAGLPNGLRRRALTWLEEQARARVGAKEKP